MLAKVFIITIRQNFEISKANGIESLVFVRTCLDGIFLSQVLEERDVLKSKS